MLIKRRLIFFAIQFCILQCFGQDQSLMEADLVEIKSINPNIKIDLVWATGKNYLNLVLYEDAAKCYLHREVIYALDKVQKELESMGYGLLIIEAFRPLWAQKKFWQAISYVPKNPEDGRHTRGLSVDLTIINLTDGSMIPMPPFGSESDKDTNHGHVEGLTKEQIANRDMLKNIMIKYGFAPLNYQWFHYDYKDWEKYKRLNYKFSELN